MAPRKKGLLFGLFGKSKKETNELDHVSITVFALMEEVMLAVINCWNNTELYNAKDNLFTRLGVLPYKPEDDKLMAKQIRERIKGLIKLDLETRNPMAVRVIKQVSQAKILLKDPNTDQIEDNVEQETSMSHEEYLQSHFNLVQKHIVDFLQPLTDKYVDHIIQKTLNIWGMSATFNKIGISVNVGCEKIIQILLSLSIPPYRVIESVQEYIRVHEWNCVKQKKDMTLEHKEKDSATTQSLYC